MATTVTLAAAVPTASPDADPWGDAGTFSALPTQTYGQAATNVPMGSGATGTGAAYIEVDMTAYAGLTATGGSHVLTFLASSNGNNSSGLARVSVGVSNTRPFTESTVNYANAPATPTTIVVNSNQNLPTGSGGQGGRQSTLTATFSDAQVQQMFGKWVLFVIDTSPNASVVNIYYGPREGGPGTQIQFTYASGVVVAGSNVWTETFTQGQTTWRCPSKAIDGFDVTSIQTIEARAPGSSGGTGASLAGGGSGGGGAYSKKTAALAVTPGTTYNIRNAFSSDTWFSTTTVAPTSTAEGCMAKRGTGGGAANLSTPGTAGTGGTAAASIGDTKFNGGAGAAGAATTGGGGGGGSGDAGAGGAGTTAGVGGAAGTSGGGTGGTGGTALAAGQAGATPGGGGGGGGTGVNTALGAGSVGSLVITYHREYASNSSDVARSAGNQMDAVTRSVVTARPLVDSIALGAESVARTLLSARPESDSIPIGAEAMARRFTGFRPESDSIPIGADTDVRLFIGTRPSSDSIPTTDSLARSFAGARTQSDSIPISPETLARHFTGFRSTIETIAIGVDTVVRFFVGTRPTSDSIPTTDTSARQFTGARSESDNIPTTDTFARRFTGLRSLADSIPIGVDAVVRFFTGSRAISDSIPTTDTATRTLQAARTESDNIPTTDTFTRKFTGFRSESDAIPIGTETLTRLYVGARAESDSIPTTDSVARGIIYGRTTQDGAADFIVRFPTKAINGVVYDHETGSPISVAATVKLYRDSDDLLCQTQVVTAPANGVFSFPRDLFDPNTYWYTATYTTAGGVQIHGVSDRGQVPV